MPVAVQLEFKGATLEQYDQVIEKMGLKPESAGAPGGLFHWVAKTVDGIRVVDVWETKERFEQFAQDEIGPHTQAVGIPSPPEITYFDVHNYLTKG